MPHSGVRPQAVVDAQGTVHVVYSGREHRDLFYIRQAAGKDGFSKPIQVNSTPDCAAAFNMALGKQGRVHVLIRPNAKYSMNRLNRRPKFDDLKYMLYCRLNDEGTAFAAERDLSGETYRFEGVGAIIADGRGIVRVFWHGQTKPGRENTRSIYMVRSGDEGKTFTEPTPIESDVIGACACCSMQATMDARGRLYLAVRNSIEGGNKDSYLLTSSDGGKSFKGELLGPWPEAGCPGSIYSLATDATGVVVAWDTLGKVYFAKVGEKPLRIAAPLGDKISRAPVVAVNARGDVLLAWSEASTARQFRKSGDLAWQVYNKAGKPITKKQVLPHAVARYSFAATCAKPNGDFVILYDGPGAKPE